MARKKSGIENGLNSVVKNADKMKAFRQETARLNSMANKRVRRMLKKAEQNGFTSPAFEKWKKEGSQFFEIRNKTSWNELQKERARVSNFLNSATSSITGTTNILKEMAKNTGLKYKGIADLQSKSKKFFELSNKIDQYYKSKNGEYKGYQTIWDNINKYVKLDGIDLNTANVDELIEPIVKLIDEQYKEEQASYSSGLDNLLL